MKAPTFVLAILALVLALPAFAGDDEAPPEQEPATAAAEAEIAPPSAEIAPPVDPCATTASPEQQAELAEVTAWLGTDATAQAAEALTGLGSEGCRALATWLADDAPGGSVADVIAARMHLARHRPEPLPGTSYAAASDAKSPQVTAVEQILSEGGPEEAEAFATTACEQARADGRTVTPWVDPLQGFVLRTADDPGYTAAGLLSARALGLAEGPGIDATIDAILDQGSVTLRQGLASGLAERIAAGQGDPDTQARLDRLQGQ